MGHQPFHDSTSGAKVIISDKTTKCCAIFLGSNLILVDLYCFRDYSSSVYSCSTLKDMVAVRLLIPTADAKVARASHETDDTCMENLPLGRLRAYFPHKPLLFQARTLSAHQQRGWATDGISHDMNRKTEALTSFRLPSFCFCSFREGKSLWLEYYLSILR